MDKSNKEYKIQLSASEVMFLRNNSFLPEILARIIERAKQVNKSAFEISVSREIAEQFRASFTDRLARFGFDSNYKLTDEGSILEALVDRFYLC